MSIVSDAVRELAGLIERTSGNVIPEGHLPFLKEIAAQRARACRLRDLAAYVEAMARGAIEGEWSRLLPLITVNESYFFRGPQQFRALRETILPSLIRARSAARRLRLWSAGCARGEEPATLAILLSEIDALAGWDWRVVASDVDEAALADARAGLYSARAVSQVPPELRQRHFTRSGEFFVLSRQLLTRIDYRTVNLVHEPFEAPQGRLDVIMLRNVLIYFRPESQRRVVHNISSCMAQDGALFLGPSETLWQLSEDLVPHDLGDCFCYRPRQSEPTSSRPVRRPPTPSRRPAPPAAPPRPRTSAPPRSARQPQAVQAPERPTPTPLTTITLAIVENRLEDARAAVRHALQASQTDAALRTLEGLVHDLSGEPDEAAAAYRAALFLDPSLFQTRLLLADTLRQLGWEARANHEYREVLAHLAAGRARELEVERIDLPDRSTATARCRAALQRS